MTELGGSLFEEGFKKGLEEGKQEKAIEITKKAIEKSMSDELISKLTELPIEQIGIIRKYIKNN